MTDPIADFLTRIRNAVSVGHKVVEIPGSKIKLEMTKILKEKGYILNYKFEQEGARSNIKIALKYHPETKVPAIKSLVRRAMDMGFYEGVNLSLAYCDDCGHEELSMDVCPVCGSKNLTKIDRMNGYLSYSRVHGDTRLNEAKMAEIAERKSM